MPNGKGYVVEASTHEARLNEVSKWAGDAWWPELYRLNFRLSRIDPFYTLIQFKEKFDSPRFYFSTSSGRRPEMQKIVEESCQIMMKADEQRKVFDRYAVPPNPWNDDFTPMKF